MVRFLTLHGTRGSGRRTGALREEDTAPSGSKAQAAGTTVLKECARGTISSRRVNVKNTNY